MTRRNAAHVRANLHLHANMHTLPHTHATRACVDLHTRVVQTTTHPVGQPILWVEPRTVEWVTQIHTNNYDTPRVRACCGEGSKSEGVLW